MKVSVILAASVGMLIAGAANAQTVSVCPDNFEAFAGTTEPLTCTCTAEAVKQADSRQLQYPVEGMDVYTGSSPLCLAAVHAGVIARNGGALTVMPEPGRAAYPGVTRNGITSRNARAEKSSFRFAAAPGATAATPAPAPAPTAAAPATTSVCPDNFEAFAGTTEPLACTCTAEAVKHADSRQLQYPVEGMDMYTGSSPVCLAAVHAGVIGRNGGALTVIPEPGRDAYPGVTRNGIASRNARAEKSSFRFAAAPGATAATPAPAPAPTAAAPATTSVCPDNFEAFAGTTEPLACTCTAEAVKHADSRQLQYPVEGMDVYTGGSPVCLAAVHAGVIARNGGALTVIPEPGRDAYSGVTRNGITSKNARAEKSSFRFAAAPGSTAATPAPAPTSATAAPASTSVCPDNFEAFAGTSEPLTCACTAEAVKHADSRQLQYPVEGMDVYTGGSPVCLAAVHAGVIARNGGALTVIPEPGRAAYPGVTRNGITSRNARAEKSSFRFAAPAQPVVVGDKPVQQPIAATIQQTGQVQLYIQFRFNSADLDESAIPTLMELRDALNASPNLRLMLVGHTDSVGTPDYNRSLSLRRAQSVMNWLAAQGVARTKLAVDGKGQDQPIADNGTDQGRALNRRVQALRLP